MQLVLITGLSGLGQKRRAERARGQRLLLRRQPAGRSSCPSWSQFLRGAGYSRVASASTCAAARPLESLPQQLADLRGGGIDVKVLFLDAKDDTLIQRFSETRRRHPLGDGELHRRRIDRARARDARRDRGPLASHRHERAESATRCAAGYASSSQVPDGRADAALPIVRVQARHSARHRHRVRRALPAQSVTTIPGCGRSPAGTRR